MESGYTLENLVDDSTDGKFFGSSAYMRGYEDLEHGVPKGRNPYVEGSKDAVDYLEGYQAAAKFWFGNSAA